MTAPNNFVYIYHMKAKKKTPWLTLAFAVLSVAALSLCFAYKVKLDGYVKASQQQVQKP